jgi:hypothetical protein
MIEATLQDKGDESAFIVLLLSRERQFWTDAVLSRLLSGIRQPYRFVFIGPLMLQPGALDSLT